MVARISSLGSTVAGVPARTSGWRKGLKIEEHDFDRPTGKAMPTIRSMDRPRPRFAQPFQKRREYFSAVVKWLCSSLLPRCSVIFGHFTRSPKSALPSVLFAGEPSSFDRQKASGGKVHHPRLASNQSTRCLPSPSNGTSYHLRFRAAEAKWIACVNRLSD